MVSSRSQGVVSSQSTAGKPVRGLVSNSKKTEFMKNLTYTIENKSKMLKEEYRENMFKVVKKEGKIHVFIDPIVNDIIMMTVYMSH